MKPLRHRASEGRANPKGIPCLYLATTEKTAILEVRPWIGSYVSAGQFKLLRDCTLIDCSKTHRGFPIYFEEPDVAEREKAVWTGIDRAFAEPATRQDDTADYAATQIIAELFKRQGFDGIAYKSNFGEDGHNVALFDLDAADLINCTICKVDKVDIEYEERDNRYFVTKHYPKLSKPAKPASE
jgi:RES domain